MHGKGCPCNGIYHTSNSHRSLYETPSFRPPFKETFNSAVEKAMLLLGESGKQATYYHLKNILSQVYSRKNH
jgi:hypothetical protein